MLVVGVLVAACGGHGSAARTPASNAGQASSLSPGTGTASSTPTSQAATSGSPGGGVCATSALVVTVGESGAAAGTTYRHLDFQNRTSQPCTLTGYPGVSFTDAAGAQVGYPAGRNPTTAPMTVTVQPGQYANAVLGVPDPANFPSNMCSPRTTANLRVYPPNQRASVQVPDKETVCTTASGRASITPVTAGR